MIKFGSKFNLAVVCPQIFEDIVDTGSFHTVKVVWKEKLMV